MPTSRKRSRKAEFWHRLDPAEVTRVMASSYGERAGAEVLLLAFLQERDMNPPGVQFWLKVYGALEEAQGMAAPARRA